MTGYREELVGFFDEIIAKGGSGEDAFAEAVDRGFVEGDETGGEEGMLGAEEEGVDEMMATADLGGEEMPEMGGEEMPPPPMGEAGGESPGGSRIAAVQAALEDDERKKAQFGQEMGR